MALSELIKYEGDNSTFIWKYPHEDFNNMTELVVHESQEAIFFANGQAADTFGLSYIDLSEIRNDTDRAGLGTNVTGEDGKWHTITEATVAEHPNDEGMRYIANQIIANLSQL